MDATKLDDIVGPQDRASFGPVCDPPASFEDGIGKPRFRSNFIDFIENFIFGNFEVIVNVFYE